MTARRIDGKAAAAAVRARVADGVAEFRARTGRAHLAGEVLEVGEDLVLVGEDPASSVYVRSKGKATLEAGMESVEHKLAADTGEAELLALVERLNADPAVDGILVQLPLPPQIDAARVIAAIDPTKDVDGFHVENAGRLAIGADAMVP